MDSRSVLDFMFFNGEIVEGFEIQPLRIKNMHKLIVKRFFEAAHQLPNTDNLLTKECCRLHGHSYLAKIEFEGSNDRSGMVIDFKGIKEVVDILDHQYINDILNVPSTAENIAKFFYIEIMKRYDLKNLRISIIEGYHGEELSNWVEYYE